MKTKEQVRVELERWLDRKAEIDMHNTINRPDPYKSNSSVDVFDDYTDQDDGEMRAVMWSIGDTGVYGDDD
jgi:hypothetical protein